MARANLRYSEKNPSGDTRMKVSMLELLEWGVGLELFNPKNQIPSQCYRDIGMG